MKKVKKSRRTSLTALLLFNWLLIALPAARAQEAGAAAQPLKPGELEQLVAPIALYPDDLLAQILMASTYPLEVIDAARWAQSNPGVKGADLESAMQNQDWDPSVKALTAVPQVLSMMHDKLDWMQRLGDAFLADQKAVLDAVQRLRSKAEANGSLQSSKEQHVSTSSSSGATTQYITIESTSPDVVYVPTYDSAAAYGAWPYPSYPPYTYYPPGYVAGTALLSFGVGMAVGGALWGNCNWGGGEVNMNVNRYNSFNRTNVSNRNWSHNAAHRRNVPYRNQNLSQKYGGQRDAAAQRARNDFRGRTEAGRAQSDRGNLDRRAGGARADGSGFRDRSASRQAGGASRQNRGGDFGSGGLGDGSRQGRSQASGRDSGAFGGIGRGSETRQVSQRGGASLDRAGSRGNAGARSSGGMRGGGGGMRGGGGGRRR